MARASELPDLPWRFTVIDDAAVNAFAMPGGYIFVTRGLLAYMQSEAQLAGVLGHEIGHVTARHSAKQITQQQLAAVGLGLQPSIEAAVGAMTRLTRTIEPDPVHQRLYDQLYRRVYRRMYDRLKPLYEEIMAITGYPPS